MRLRHIDDFATRRLLAFHHTDVVVDVGANVGQYALLARRAGFAGRIVSFEPLPSAFEQLLERATDDERWSCLPLALDERCGIGALNISRNLVSSSLLRTTAEERQQAPETAAVDQIDVRIATLDSLREELFSPDERLFLKLDVQGAEARVFAGAARTLDRVRAIECELAILKLYDGQPLISDIALILRDRGFRLVTIEPEYRDLRTGELKQVNGLFLLD